MIGKLKGESNEQNNCSTLYKGGTGKILLSVNLAATFAKQGKKVCIFDLDFRVPRLFAILKAENTETWFNDYLDNTCDVNKTLINLSSKITGNGKFYAGLANPALKQSGICLQKIVNGK